MKLNYYNAKTDDRKSILVPNTNIEKAIIDNCVLAYGDGFYVLNQIDEWTYKLNNDITCTLWP